MAKRTPLPPGRPLDPQAGYRRIATDLRKRLERNEWAPRTFFPAGRALARQYGVAENTVRLALETLRGEGWVQKNARRRLVVWPRRGAGPAQENLLLEVLGNALHKSIGDPEGRDLQHGIETGAGELALPVLIAHHGLLRGALPMRFLDLPLRGIILSGTFERTALSQYEKLACPVVMVDRPLQSRAIHSVCVDNVRAAREATVRLIARGHRRIAFLRYIHLHIHDVDPDSRERQEGFEQACRAEGLPVRADWIFNSFSKDLPSQGCFQTLFQARPRFTAVLAVSAGRARLVARAAEVHGLAVPRDLSIACFQGLHAPDPHWAGPRIDFEELGRLAVHLAWAPGAPPQRLLVPALWVDGPSAGSAAQPSLHSGLGHSRPVKKSFFRHP